MAQHATNAISNETPLKSQDQLLFDFRDFIPIELFYSIARQGIGIGEQPGRHRRKISCRMAISHERFTTQLVARYTGIVTNAAHVSRHTGTVRCATAR